MKTLAIITPTYNRAKYLESVYNSLENQTIKDFVWYVVDDGSKDNTCKVVEDLIKKSSFEIVFKSKENGGKHTALNTAYELIKEELTLILDSDDELLPDAVQTILTDYPQIKDNNKICGLGYLKCLKNLKVVGVPYTQNGIVDNFTNQRINKKVYGDKCEVYKSSILKQYKFPEFKGENFVSESVVWCKMSLDYDMKFFNKSIYACEYLEEGLSDNVHKRLFKNPLGAAECYLSMSGSQTKFLSRLKYTIAFAVYSFAAKTIVKEQYKRISSKFLYTLGVIPAWLIYLHKKRKFKD